MLIEIQKDDGPNSEDGDPIRSKDLSF